MSRALVPALLLTLLFSACSGVNPSDGAVIQEMQQAREEIKMPAHERPVRTVTVISTPNPPGNMGSEDNTDGGEFVTEVEGEVPLPVSGKRLLEAKSLAQEGRMKLIAGESLEGIALLEQSMDIVPTLEAMESLAPQLVQSGEYKRLSSHCDRAGAVLSSEERPRLQELCKSKE